MYARLHPSVYRRRRIGAGVVLSLFVVAAWLGPRVLSGVPLPAAERPMPDVQQSAPANAPVLRLASATAGRVHVVAPGETFWSIARSLRPNGDPRPLVDHLVAAHGPGALRVGETIVLPS
jgi:hypothetical protein